MTRQRGSDGAVSLRDLAPLDIHIALQKMFRLGAPPDARRRRSADLQAADSSSCQK
jgi:hypothetical protein